VELLVTRLPELQEEVDRLLEQTDNDISRLPIMPSADAEPMGELLRLIGLFVRALEQVVAGTPDADGLIQAIRGPQQDFMKKIRQTAPDFRPLKGSSHSNGIPAMPGFLEPDFLSSEEQESQWQHVEPSRIIYIEDVMERANT
jgi:hypothetical protein